MADETNTGGGASVTGNVDAKSFAGRDEIKQIVNVERDGLDDLRTDISLIKHDIENMKFTQFEMRSDLNNLRHPSTAQAASMSPLMLVLMTALIILLAIVIVVVIVGLARGVR